MPRLVILMAALAFTCVAADVAVGTAVGLGWIGVRVHADVSLLTSLLALFAWTLVAVYFAGAVAWTREALAEGRAGKDLAARARAIRAGVLPWAAAAALALMAAYVLGGGADTRSVPAAVHLGTALAALAVHVVAVYRTIVFVGMVVDLEDEVERSTAGSG